MLTTILYHKNCNDGLVAALNFYAYFKERDELENITFLPVQYGEGLPDESLIKDHEVYIVDFSYTRHDMAKIVELAGKAILLDHHESAIHNLFTGEKWLQGLVQKSIEHDQGTYLMATQDATVFVSKKHSGATLAYAEVGQYIRDERVREIVSYLSKRAEDRDNWVFDYADSKAVHEYVRSLGSDLTKVYETIFSGDLNDLFKQVDKAQARVDMREELARNYAKLAKPISLMGHEVPAVNVPSDFASIVGDILNKDAPFAVMYTVTDEKILVSLRSDKVTGVDVQAIAYKMMGGGHVNAAAFSLPHTELPSLLRGKIQENWI